MDGPGKGDVVLGGSGGDGAHVVLGHHAVEALLVGDLGGILIPPVAQVIGVTLGAVDEGVHLVVFHVLEQGENVLHRVHLAVEALDDATVLHVGIVLDGGAGQLLTGHGLHGVIQGGQAVVHGVVVLTQDGHTAIGVDVHKVGVILGLAGHKQVVGVAGGVGVHVLGRAVDAQSQGALLIVLGDGVGHALLVHDLLHPATGDIGDAGLIVDLDVVKVDEVVLHLQLLGGGVEIIGVVQISLGQNGHGDLHVGAVAQVGDGGGEGGLGGGLRQGHLQHTVLHGEVGRVALPGDGGAVVGALHQGHVPAQSVPLLGVLQLGLGLAEDEVPGVVVHFHLVDGHAGPDVREVLGDIHPDIAGRDLVKGEGAGLLGLAVGDVGHVGPLIAVVRDLDLVGLAAGLLPEQTDAVEGGGLAEVQAQPLGVALTEGAAGPAGVHVAVDGLVLGEVAGLVARRGGGGGEGQVGAGHFIGEGGSGVGDLVGLSLGQRSGIADGGQTHGTHGDQSADFLGNLAHG